MGKAKKDGLADWTIDRKGDVKLGSNYTRSISNFAETAKEWSTSYMISIYLISTTIQVALDYLSVSLHIGKTALTFLSKYTMPMIYAVGATIAVVAKGVTFARSRFAIRWLSRRLEKVKPEKTAKDRVDNLLENLRKAGYGKYVDLVNQRIKIKKAEIERFRPGKGNDYVEEKTYNDIFIEEIENIGRLVDSSNSDEMFKERLRGKVTEAVIGKMADAREIYYLHAEYVRCKHNLKLERNLAKDSAVKCITNIAMTATCIILSFSLPISPGAIVGVWGAKLIVDVYTNYWLKAQRTQKRRNRKYEEWKVEDVKGRVEKKKQELENSIGAINKEKEIQTELSEGNLAKLEHDKILLEHEAEIIRKCFMDSQQGRIKQKDFDMVTKFLENISNEIDWMLKNRNEQNYREKGLAPEDVVHIAQRLKVQFCSEHLTTDMVSQYKAQMEEDAERMFETIQKEAKAQRSEKVAEVSKSRDDYMRSTKCKRDRVNSEGLGMADVLWRNLEILKQKGILKTEKQNIDPLESEEYESFRAYLENTKGINNSEDVYKKIMKLSGMKKTEFDQEIVKINESIYEAKKYTDRDNSIPS